MNKEEVVKLSTLARVEISDTEAESLSHEFESILKYVANIKDTVGETEAGVPKSGDLALKNIFRADENPHESGIFTEAILKEAPAREGDYIKVKKII